MSGHSETCGHGLTLRPTRRQNALQSVGVWLAMNAVNCAVVPDPSERTTTRIGMLGMCALGLSAAIAGSFQFVTTPVKIFASVSGDSWRFVKR